MSKSNKDANQNDHKKLSIHEILDYENSKSQIYRDIFKFLIPKIKQLLQNHEKEKDELGQKNNQSNIESLFTANNKIDDPTSFKIRDLVNWLLENNEEFRNQYHGSREKKSYRAHSKTPFVEARINNLIELNFLVMEEDKVQSNRNPGIQTNLYSITSMGVLVALTLDLQNYHRDSNEYKNILRLLLYEWLEFLPEGYTDPYNYYYHFISLLLKKCLHSYEDIVLSFIDIIKIHSNKFEINFTELRISINIAFFRKIICDPKFKSMFITQINELNILKILNISEISDEKDRFIPELHQLLKTQFKLDIESYMDRTITENLKLPEHQIKHFTQINQPENSGKNMIKISGTQINLNRSEDHFLNFNTKLKWDRIRNQILKNSSIISLIATCNKCYQVNPYLFEYEKETFEEIKCKFCKADNLSILKETE